MISGKVKRETGQILALVLMVMGAGALLLGPLLGYINTSLSSVKKGTQAIAQYYAAEAGIEHAIWRLKYEGLSLTPETPFTYSPPSVNGLTVEAVITQKAPVTDTECSENPSGPQSDKVTIGRTVVPMPAPPGQLTTFTFTVQFSNVGTGNIHFSEIGYRLPTGFTYIPGSASGFTVVDPVPTEGALVWSFTPHPKVRPGEVVTQIFQATGILENGVYCDSCDTVWVIFTQGSIGCVTFSNAERYTIRATAGPLYIQALIRIVSGDVTILSWETK